MATNKRVSLSAIKKDKTISLSEKIELPKNEKDLDQVKEDLKKLHPENETLIKIETPVKPEDKIEVKSEQTVTDEIKTRSTVLLPKKAHVAIKVHCALHDINIQDFMEKAIIEKAKSLGLLTNE